MIENNWFQSLVKILKEDTNAAAIFEFNGIFKLTNYRSDIKTVQIFNLRVDN